jgi:hypothetical protein
VVLSTPFYDGTVETFDRVLVLVYLLLVAGLLAALYGYAWRITPLLRLELWDAEVPVPGAISGTRVSSGGLLALAAVLGVLLYGVWHETVLATASDGVKVTLTIAFSIGVAVAVIAALEVGARDRMTLVYTLVLLAWVALLPLSWLLAAPWNLLLVIVLSGVGSLLLTIFCTRWHARARAAQPTATDVRLAIGETRFPRHIARWIALALYSVLVYTVAFARTDSETDSFDRVLNGLLVAHAVLLLCLLAACNLLPCCCGSKRKSVAFGGDATAAVHSVPAATDATEQRKIAQAKSQPLASADGDDSDDAEEDFTEKYKLGGGGGGGGRRRK